MAEVCQKLASSEQTLYGSRNRYGRMAGNEVKRLKELLEAENARLKRLVADLVLDKQMLAHLRYAPAGRPPMRID